VAEKMPLVDLSRKVALFLCINVHEVDIFQFIIGWIKPCRVGELLSSEVKIPSKSFIKP